MGWRHSSSLVFDLFSGIFVSHVDPGSRADLAGLKQGDLISKVNGVEFHPKIPHAEAASVSALFFNFMRSLQPKIR